MNETTSVTEPRRTRRRGRPAQHPGRRFVGEALRLERLRRRMRQEDLAAALGVVRQTISGWERGEWLPSREQLGALAGALGCRAAVLGREP